MNPLVQAIYINGKFLAQRLTGVQRTASRLLRALDERPAGLPGRWVLLHPPGVTPPPLRRVQARSVGGGLARLGGLHRWEQLDLPRAARDGLLLNFAGSAPWCARRQVCTLHDAAPWDVPGAYTRAFVLWYRLLFRHLARHAEHLLTVSAWAQGRLAHALDVPAGRIDVVPNGADHLDEVLPDDGVLARHGLQAGRYVLAVASANPTKNLALLVRAWQRARRGPADRLVIVGGVNAAVFKREGAEAGDAPGLVRTGPVDDRALKALYLGAAGLVFPSTYEGFGLPPVEAMACGCPVVVARAASLPEVCGDAALYVDPGSVDEVADAIGRLLADDALRERLRSAGRQQALRWRWSASAERLLQVLRLDGVPAAVGVRG